MKASGVHLVNTEFFHLRVLTFNVMPVFSQANTETDSNPVGPCPSSSLGFGISPVLAIVRGSRAFERLPGARGAALGFGAARGLGPTGPQQ